MTAAEILARLAALKQRLGHAEEAWISPAQKKWAVTDIWAEIEALEEELDALARQQEEEEK